MDRRELIVGGASLAAAVALAPRVVAARSPDAGPNGLRALARQAWMYGLPLIEMASARNRALAAAPANTLLHQRELQTPATQTITAPNNDTLYSRAVLDLSRGPVALDLPAIGSRYQSVALMDMFTNNFAVLGSRTTGPQGGSFVIAGPTGAAPKGAIRSPGPWVFLLGRTVVNGPSDLDSAHRAQDGLKLAGPSGAAPTAVAPVARMAAWRDFFGSVGALLRETPPPATDRAFFYRAAALGLTPDGFTPPDFTPAQEAQISAGVADAVASSVRPRSGTYQAGGWSYPRANLGDFGQDYEFRAQIALTGLGALPLAEAVYTRSIGEKGSEFFNGGRYRLHFDADKLPPVDAFWSLTAYKAMAEGQFLFAPNAIDRYSIGDRTPGLRYGPDGSLDLWISRTDPGGPRTANWLPAPDGAFILSLRAYLPRPSLLTGEYRFPALIPV